MLEGKNDSAYPWMVSNVDQLAARIESVRQQVKNTLRSRPDVDI